MGNPLELESFLLSDRLVRHQGRMALVAEIDVYPGPAGSRIESVSLVTKSCIGRKWFAGVAR
jgi:hypothetical protein